MARVAEVECGAVTVTVTAASVLLDFIIVTSNPAATKATVKTALATTTGASTALAVTVERVPTVAVRFCPPKRLGATPYRTVATSAYRMHPPLQVMSGTGGASKTTKPSIAASGDSNSSSIGPIIGGVGEQRPCNALSARPAGAHTKRTPPQTRDPAELAPCVACLAHSWRLAGALLLLHRHRRRRLCLHEAEEGSRLRRRKPSAGRRDPDCTQPEYDDTADPVTYFSRISAGNTDRSGAIAGQGAGCIVLD